MEASTKAAEAAENKSNSKSIIEIKASEMTHGNTGFNFEGGSGTGFYSSPPPGRRRRGGC
jgi:hypothetical protein